MPPRVNSLTHSRTILSSSSVCFSAAEAGGGAVVDNMFFNTSAGSSVCSAILCSRASWSFERPAGSGVSDGSSISCEESDGMVLVRLDTLLQNERRDATVRATGEVVTENSEDG